MKRILSSLFLGILCLYSCHSNTTEPSRSNSSHQTLKINIQGDIASIHPHVGVDLQCRIFQKALFEGLTRIDLDGTPMLAGAEKLEISPCQKKYTFTLRPMQWTNGEKVTAHHFEKSWKNALLPNSNCLRPDIFYSIKNAEKVKKQELPLDALKVNAINDQTLIVELEHPMPYFLDLLANPIFAPLYDDSPVPTVFNGPFRIARWDSEKQHILEKNPFYWDNSEVSLSQIEVSQVRDPTTALLMYEKSELDWIGHPFTSLPHDALEKLEHCNEFCSHPIAGVYWVSLNTQTFPLNSTFIRKALSVALNRVDLAQHVLLGETPTKSIVPTGISLHQNDELYADSNLELSKNYFNKGLEELGITREEFPRLSLEYTDVPGQKKLAEAMQEAWKLVLDIDVDLIGSEWNIFFTKLNKKQFQIGGCIWYFLYYDPSYALNFFRDRNQCYNATGWENFDYQQLLKLADEETDSALRRKHLKDAERILLDEMPIIPLFVYHSKYLKSPNLKNLIVNDLGHADFKWAYFE